MDRRRFLSGLGAGAALALSAGRAGAQAACKAAAHPLKTLFAAFAALDAKTATAPVRLVQLGDSHTAGDLITGAVRAALQRRFGNAGRGLLTPGVAWPGFNPDGATVTATGSWAIANAFQPEARGPFGIAGIRATGTGRGTALTMELHVPHAPARAEVLALGGEGRGSFTLTGDGLGAPVRCATAGPAKVLRFTAEARELAGITLTLEGDGPVELLAWGVEQPVAGVQLASFGVAGAEIETTTRFEPAIVAQELRAIAPAALIVAFGTNEGFRDDLDEAAYRTLYARQVASFAKAAGGVPVIVMGPPDGNRMPDYARTNPPPVPGYPCRGLTAAEEATYTQRLAAKDRTLGRWHTPPAFARVRRAQAAAAKDAGWWFWDWEKLMPGPCGIHAWAREADPRALTDHVHFTRLGSEFIAGALADELMDGYARWACRPG